MDRKGRFFMKIAVVNSFMNDAHREKISAAAAQHGMEVAYYRTNDEALPHLSDVDIIYAAATGGGSKLAEAAPHLKWFCSVSAGVDPVLKPGVLPEGCLLSNSSGAYGVTIAEHLVMVTLMLLRRYPEYAEIIRRHEWKNNLPLRSIKDSRVTIVGTGDIGTRYAERIQSFQPAAIVGVSRTGRKRSPVYDEAVKQEELEAYLPKTDILVLCLPGTKETTNMISRERLAMLPDDALSSMSAAATQSIRRRSSRRSTRVTSPAQRSMSWPRSRSRRETRSGRRRTSS